MGDYLELFDNLSRVYRDRAIRGLVEAGESLEDENSRKFHSALIDVVQSVNERGPASRIIGCLPSELYLLAMTKCSDARTPDGEV